MIGIGLVYTEQLTLAEDSRCHQASPMIIIGIIPDLAARNNFKWRRYPYIIRQINLSWPWSIVEKRCVQLHEHFFYTTLVQIE